METSKITTVSAQTFPSQTVFNKYSKTLEKKSLTKNDSMYYDEFKEPIPSIYSTKKIDTTTY